MEANRKGRHYRKYHGNVRVPCLGIMLIGLALVLAGCDGIGTFDLGVFREPVTGAWLVCAPLMGCVTVWSK